MENAAVRRRAPSVTLEAIGHKRKITLDAIGVPAALVFVGREKEDAAVPVVDAIRAKYPLASQIVVATVADARGLPRIVRKIARMMMKSSYDEAVAKLEHGKSPEEYVLLLPDWDGSVMAPLNIEGVSKTIAVAVLDAHSYVTGIYQGYDVSTRALTLIRQAREER